jgi:hypothetical protein
VADAEVDAAEGVDLLVAHLIGLPEALGDDDLAGVGTSLGGWFGPGAFEFGVGCGFGGHRVLRVIAASARGLIPTEDVSIPAFSDRHSAIRLDCVSTWMKEQIQGSFTTFRMTAKKIRMTAKKIRMTAKKIRMTVKKIRMTVKENQDYGAKNPMVMRWCRWW